MEEHCSYFCHGKTLLLLLPWKNIALTSAMGEHCSSSSMCSFSFISAMSPNSVTYTDSGFRVDHVPASTLTRIHTRLRRDLGASWALVLDTRLNQFSFQIAETQATAANKRTGSTEHHSPASRTVDILPDFRVPSRGGALAQSTRVLRRGAKAAIIGHR